MAKTARKKKTKNTDGPKFADPNMAVVSPYFFISHRYWDTATYWPKIANFAHPLSFNALVRSDLLRIYV